MKIIMFLVVVFLICGQAIAQGGGEIRLSYSKYDGVGTCGAALIQVPTSNTETEVRVLTAAHCVDPGRHVGKPISAEFSVNGRTWIKLNINNVSMNNQYDIALLTPTGRISPSSAQPVIPTFRNPEGARYAGPATNCTGQLQRIANAKNQMVLAARCDRTLEQGHSGSPLQVAGTNIVTGVVTKQVADQGDGINTGFSPVDMTIIAAML